MKSSNPAITFLFFIVTSLFHNNSTAQHTLARNVIYIEATTKGAYYSINYDRLFKQGEKLSSTFRIGFSVLNNAIAFPLEINFLTGNRMITLNLE